MIPSLKNQQTSNCQNDDGRMKCCTGW